MSAPALTQDALKEMLDYNLVSGIFTWLRRSDMREQWNGNYAGSRAGYVWRATGGRTYRSIHIGVRPYPEHRLAWLFMTGEFPSEVIDHADRNGENNRWENLRAATRSQNCANAGAWKNNKTGVRGVCLGRYGRFRATIKIDGKQKYLGVFSSVEEARVAYMAAASDKFGCFADSES